MPNCIIIQPNSHQTMLKTIAKAHIHALDNARDLRTTSRAVADFFGKNHKEVLRSIQSLECSVSFNKRNFAPVEYKDSKGEKRPMYEITANGFAFLAMGFTGKEAAQFKEAYIEAFSELRAENDTLREAHAEKADRMLAAHYAKHPEWRMTLNGYADGQSRRQIAKAAHKHPITIGRYLRRLVSAGIVTEAQLEKMYHTGKIANHQNQLALLEA